jgi:hypothetical protein
MEVFDEVKGAVVIAKLFAVTLEANVAPVDLKLNDLLICS